MAVAFDAVGPSSAGVAGTGTTLSWTHVCGAGASTLLVAIAVGPEGGALDTGVTTTATYNGVSMTSLGVTHSNNGTVGYLEVFALQNPTTGSNTVLVTRSGGSGTISLVGGSMSYTGSGSTAHVITAFANGTTVSTTVTSAVGNFVVGFACAGSAFTIINRTLRYRDNDNTNSAAGNAQGGDSAGASSIVVTHTYGTDWSAALGVDVVVAATGKGIPAPSRLSRNSLIRR